MATAHLATDLTQPDTKHDYNYSRKILYGYYGLGHTCNFGQR